MRQDKLKLTFVVGFFAICLVGFALLIKNEPTEIQRGKEATITVDIVVIDSCQYFKNFVGEDNKHIVFTHKGNCTNQIHITPIL